MGDNYINIEAIDHIGNVCVYDLNIVTQEIKNEVPSIILNNNIYN